MPLQYATRIQAQQYFDGRLQTFPWDSASPSDQDKALMQATTLIERLNFAGVPNTLNQLMKFPRGTDTQVPQDILSACAEIALVLLDDVDVNKEMKKINISDARISSVNTRTDTTQNPPDWQLAGIPSPIAWNFLKPYLRDPLAIELARIN